MLKRILAILAAILVLPAFVSDADAKPKKKKRSHSSYSRSDDSAIGSYGPNGYVMNERRGRSPRASGTYRSSERMSLGYSSYSSGSSRSYGVGPRPSRWCGWWMRTQRGGGPEYNVAWNWRKYGSPSSPQVGAVVVWRHHVGQIVGQTADGRWLVQSGNDGGRVRTRPRSIAGAIIRI